jgi:alpha-1,2-mannosyltransferase
VFLVATSDGLNDYQGRPLGTDFSNIYAGGTYVLDGQPGTAFDPPSQHARQQMIFGKDTPFYGWCYPPFLLFVAAALALLPYAGALFVWQASTLLLYLSMLWDAFRFSPSRESDGQTLSRDRLWLLLAVAFPAVFVNLGHGDNGFLKTALIGVALLVWTADRSLPASCSA